jgi:hypothetical protein
MSALGQKQTWAAHKVILLYTRKRTCAAYKLMSALPPKRHQMRHMGMSAKGR